MQVRVSHRSGPAGERVVVGFSDAALAVVRWTDPDRPETDLTGWLADLILLGWVAANEPATDTVAEPDDVPVGTLALDGVQVHLLDADEQTWELDADTARTWAMLGVVRMIVAGVAHEEADVPDDLGPLTDEPARND